jgi:hypothetical protein
MSKLTSYAATALLALVLTASSPLSAHAPVELRASSLGEALVLCGTLPTHQVAECDSAAFASFIPATTEGK